LLVKLTYKEDNEKSDYQLKVLVLAIVISLFIIPLFRNMLVTIVVLTALVILIRFISTSDGEIELFQDKEAFFFKLTPKEGDLAINEQIAAYEFSWNYNRLDDAGLGNITFIFLKLEFTTVSGNKYMIGKELQVWQSLPKDWDYKVFDEEKDHRVLITSNDMDKIKKQVENTMN